MEKKIMKMKQEIAEQNRFYGALAVLGLIAVCAMSSGVITSRYSDLHAAEFVHGFIVGIVIVIEILSLYKIVKNHSVLKDETALARLYNELHDERALQIRALSGQKGLQITMVAALAVGLVVSFFSLEAFLGILGVVMLAGIVEKCCLAYYNRTYTGE